MKQFKEFITEEPTRLVLDPKSMEFRNETEFLVDTVYSGYIDFFVLVMFMLSIMAIAIAKMGLMIV